MSDQYQSNVGDAERTTQDRVVAFFKQLGYRYLGNEQDNQIDHFCLNSNHLKDWLKKQHRYNDDVINNVIATLDHKIGECHKCGNYADANLYDINQTCYAWMRNGIVVDNPKTGTTETVMLVDWEHAENNDFSFAEEVWFRNHQSATDWRRADIIVYINGMAIADIELKKASVSVNNAVLQLQKYVENNLRAYTFNALLVAGNESQGMRYGAIGAKSEFYMQWREDEPDRLRRNGEQEIEEIQTCRRVKQMRLNTENVLLQDLASLFEKSRLLDLMRWCVLYDGGIKKIARYHQYFALTASRQRLTHCSDGKGGIIWHTQGSGKTITMVCIMRWILENLDNPRILIVTDREELDAMMSGVMFSNKEMMPVGYSQAKNCANLRDLLEEKQTVTHTKIICTLIHKFLNKKYDGAERNDSEFVKAIQEMKPIQYKGNFYIFIDECHRSQAGAMHAAMRKLIPNSIMIGFTGTPIIKAEKQSINRLSQAIFGDYIHQYKYDQAVSDQVVLPLRYEARKAGILLIDKDELDDEIQHYFDENHPNLTEEEREILNRRYASKAYDDEKRLTNVAKDIISDFKPSVTSPNKPIPRLQNGGNAMLAVHNIYRAFKYYEIFQKRDFKECAVVASYEGDAEALERNDNSDECFKAKEYKKLLEKYGQNNRDSYETYIREKFVKEPNNVKLLIVVDKLLTGFDAPKCSVLYLDKPMKDHTMFQAVCRVNRLDDESKAWGLIVDYCFQLDRLQSAMGDYTGGDKEGSDVMIPGFDPEDLAGMIEMSKEAAYQRFSEMLDALDELCREMKDVHGNIDLKAAKTYFLSDGDPETLKHRREDLYQYTGALIRNYHAMPGQRQTEYRKPLRQYAELRETIKLNSDEHRELPDISSAIRTIISDHLRPEKVTSRFSLSTLTGLSSEHSRMDVVHKLIDMFHAANQDIDGVHDKNDKDLAADIIRNNIMAELRSRMDQNPAKYKKLSELLEEYLKKYEEAQKTFEDMVNDIQNDIVDKMDQPDENLPENILHAAHPEACGALYKNLIENEIFIPEECEIVVVEIERVMLEEAQAEWRSNPAKRGNVEECIWRVLEVHGKANESALKLVMDIISNQDVY